MGRQRLFQNGSLYKVRVFLACFYTNTKLSRALCSVLYQCFKQCWVRIWSPHSEIPQNEGWYKNKSQITEAGKTGKRFRGDFKSPLEQSIALESLSAHFYTVSLASGTATLNQNGCDQVVAVLFPESDGQSSSILSTLTGSDFNISCRTFSLPYLEMQEVEPETSRI